MRLLSVFIVALFVTLGCSESPEVARCVPGQTVVCPCLGGGSGVQTCTQNEVYGVCQGCETEDMDEPDQPLDSATPDTPTDSVLGTPCTPVGSASGSPSPGVCEGSTALNCVDGTYQAQDCGSEVCRQVPLGIGESEYPFAICTEFEGELCTLQDEPICENENVKWCEPFTIQNWPYTTEFHEIYGSSMEGNCQSDEVCDRGLCVLQGGECDEYEARCEGDGSFVQCYPGEPRIRYGCAEGSVCRSSLACDFGGVSCVLEGLLQEQTCAQDAPAAECLGPDLVRICPGTECWGETECTCLPRYQNCSEGYRCQNGACVADVDCTQGTRCDGDVLIECDGPPSFFDCGLEGLSCVEMNGEAGCGQPNAQSCTGFDMVCEGNAVSGCCQATGFFIGRSVIPCIPGYELAVECTRPDSPPYTCSNGECEFRF